MSDLEAQIVSELKALGNVTQDASTFDLPWQGHLLHVEYVGGSSSSLAISVPYDASAGREPALRTSGYRDSAVGDVVAIRPMEIHLRPETMSDVVDKTEHVSREWQTGDAVFDVAVYVDTPTTKPEALSAVLSQRTRDGARALIVLGFKTIVIDDDSGRVKASLTEFTRLEDQRERAKAIADAFVLLLSGLPRVRAGGGAHPRKPLAASMMLGGIAAFVLGLGLPIWFFGIAGALDCTEGSADGEGSTLKDGCGGGAVLGAVAGFAAAFVAVMLMRGPLRRGLGGRSDSGARVTKGLISTGTIAFALVFLLVAGLVMAQH